MELSIWKKEETSSPKAKLYIVEKNCEEFSDIWHICQNIMCQSKQNGYWFETDVCTFFHFSYEPRYQFAQIPGIII